MADISTELATIRNSVYGREMRAAIGNGLEKVNEESSEVHTQIDIVVEAAEAATEAAASAEEAKQYVMQYTPEGYGDLVADVTDVTSWELKRDTTDTDYLVISGSNSQTHGRVYAPVSQLASVIDSIYPVGSIYMTLDTLDPNTQWAGTTWVRLEDRFLLGASSTYAANSQGGEATHTLTVQEMPSHTHSVRGKSIAAGSGSGTAFRLEPDKTAWVGSTTSNGSNQPHNNMPPYLAVYMWQRTA